MSRLNTCKLTELSAETLAALEPFKLNGKVSNVYLQFANSEAAIQAYLQMENSLKAGSLSAIQLEAIKLWISQQTGCEFCLSVHSLKAAAAGLVSSSQLAIRRDEPTGDKQLDALLELVKVLYRQPGSISPSALSQARSEGLTDENLVDLTMAMSTIFFTNITNHINDTQSSLKPAPEI